MRTWSRFVLGVLPPMLVASACGATAQRVAPPQVTSTTRAGTPSTGALATCATGWAVARNPSTPGDQDVVRAAAAVAYNDVWAVGTRYQSNPAGIGEPTDALIEHWDGATWTVVPGAALAVHGADLLAVAAVAADDVWAVGSVDGAPGATHGDPLIEHWDGRAWSMVAAPHSSGNGSRRSRPPGLTTSGCEVVTRRYRRTASR